MLNLVDAKAELRIQLKKQAALLAKSEQSDEDVAELDELTKDIEARHKEIKAEEDKAATLKAARERAAEIEASINTDASASDASSVPPSVSKVRENVQDDPKFGFANMKEIFTSLANQKQGKATSENFKVLAAIGSDEYSTNNKGYGGVYIPTGLLSETMSRGNDGDPVGALTRKIPMDTKAIDIPDRQDYDHSSDSSTGGSKIYWPEETGARTPSRSKRDLIRFEAHRMELLAYATEDLLDESPVSFAAIIENDYMEERPSELMRKRIRGSGTGCPTGIIGHAGTINHERATSGDVTYADLTAMSAKAWRGLSPNAVWIANPELQETLLNMVDGDGRNLWGDATNGKPGLLLGRPVIYSEHASALGATGDIILGVWNHYWEGRYGATKNLSSIHARFVNAEVAIRISDKVAGRPGWTDKLTPENATSGFQMAPFITLGYKAPA